MQLQIFLPHRRAQDCKKEPPAEKDQRPKTGPLTTQLDPIGPHLTGAAASIPTEDLA